MEVFAGERVVLSSFGNPFLGRFLRPAVPSSGWLASSKDSSTHYTPLHYAALHGHHDVCKFLIESDKLLSSAKDKRGCLPLHLASWNGHQEVVKLLSESHPPSVDAVNNAQESPLHLAAQHGHDKLVRILLEHHADPRLRNARFETPLDVAARTGHSSVCKILVGFCPELTLQSAMECSSTGENEQIRAQVVYPLHVAARHSHIQCLQILRLGGFDIDFVTDEGSALHVAAMFGQVDAVKYLIGEGINPHVRDSKGRTALELLREQEQHRVSDLTHIIQSREGWKECRQLIEGYIQRLEYDHVNSSSDSGIDRRDSERSVLEDDSSCEVWRSLLYTTNEDLLLMSPRNPSKVINIRQQPDSTKVMVAVESLRATPTKGRDAENVGPLKDLLHVDWPHLHPAPIHRTWNSSMFNAESGIARFPITSPMNKARHQKSKRTNGVMPFSFSCSGTGGVCQRAANLPSDPQRSTRPTIFDVWHQKWVQSDGITHTYNPAFPYDNYPCKEILDNNASPPGHSRWSNECSLSVGRKRSTIIPTAIHAQETIQTLPHFGTKLRPSLDDAFAVTLGTALEECTSMKLNDSSSTIREREDSLGLSHSPHLNSSDPSMIFASSTLGRPSPDTLSRSTLTGRAPLAIPEELTGSTSTSILSSSVSPEREAAELQTSSDFCITAYAPALLNRGSFGRNGRSDTDFSLSTLTVSYSDGRLSPEFAHDKNGSGEELISRSSKQFPVSNTATENNSGAMVSSCSLPIVSQLSATSASDSTFFRLYHGNSEDTNAPAGVKMRAAWNSSDCRNLESSSSKESENQSINELDEWNKLASPAAVKPVTVRGEVPPPSSYHTEWDSANMSNWLRTAVGITATNAVRVGQILTTNGFDKCTQLYGSLTTRELSYLGIEKSIQDQILSYLSTVDDPRPNANTFNYVSDWLCSLELTDYLGNFVAAGLKSMLVVRTADLSRTHLEKMGITLQGHIARILYSLEKAKAEDVCKRNERLKGMQNALTSSNLPAYCNIARNSDPFADVVERRNSAAIKQDLLHGHESFSAHYLGTVEISNIDGTEESRRAMTELKKAIREIAKVPQVILEISIHGVRIRDGKNGRLAAEHDISHIQIVCQDERDLNCFTYISQDRERNLCHVFSVLTADVATEIIVTLGQAFELSYKLQNELNLEENVIV
ncbi:hypothetical protein RB195_025380 [Necator americanus]|uniref:Ankyrin repeat protein n=1 Tax=Necator americanus TaxID=51031 RepID=A0ABR1ES91_NECAM